MQCGDFKILLSKSLDQELRMEERLALRDHLSACRACRNEKSELERVHTLISSVLKGMRSPRKIRSRLLELFAQPEPLAVSTEAPQENPAPTTAPESVPSEPQMELIPEVEIVPPAIVASAVNEESLPPVIAEKIKPPAPETSPKPRVTRKVSVSDVQMSFFFDENETKNEIVSEEKEKNIPATQPIIHGQEISPSIDESQKDIFVEHENSRAEQPPRAISEIKKEEDFVRVNEISLSFEKVPESDSAAQVAKAESVSEGDKTTALPLNAPVAPNEKIIGEVPVVEISQQVAPPAIQSIQKLDREIKPEQQSKTFAPERAFVPPVKEEPSFVEVVCASFNNNFIVQSWRTFSEKYRLTTTYLVASMTGLLFLFMAGDTERLSVNITITQTAGGEIVLRFSHAVDRDSLGKMCRLQNKMSKEVWPLQFVELTSGDHRIFNVVPAKALPRDTAWIFSISPRLADRKGVILMERHVVKEFFVGK